jgi:hypothetical protein
VRNALTRPQAHRRSWPNKVQPVSTTVRATSAAIGKVSWTSPLVCQNGYTHSTAVDLSRKKGCGTILAFVAATFSPLPIAGSSTSPHQVWRSGLRQIPVPTATVFEAPRQALGMPLLPTLMMCPLGRSSPPPIRLPRPTGSLTWHGSRTRARDADSKSPATLRTVQPRAFNTDSGAD